MTTDEISEELEAQYGPASSVTEHNISFIMSLVKSREMCDGSVSDDVPPPSVDALAMTIMAIMSYPDIPWPRLAEKPSIRRSLTYLFVRGIKHYDEVEALVKQLLRKHVRGLTARMVLAFLAVVRPILSETAPTPFIDCVNSPEHYDAIYRVLRSVIRPGKPEYAALVITCAIEDGLLTENLSRMSVVNEFGLTKSSYSKFFTLYHDRPTTLPPHEQRFLSRKKENVKAMLRTRIGYTYSSEGVVFLDRAPTFRSILTLLISHLRKMFGASER